MPKEGIKHELSYTKGTDARNHIVKCSCSFSASDTYLGIRKRGQFHAQQANPLRWDDPDRIDQSDKKYPSYRAYSV